MMARAMKSGSGAFDVDDYISKLVIFMGGRHNVEEVGDDDGDSYDDEGDGAPLDWERIGWKAVAHSHRVPVMDFMCVCRRFSVCFTQNLVQAWSAFCGAEEAERG